MKNKNNLLKVALGILLSSVFIQSVKAVETVPDGTKVFGKSLGTWSAEWWQNMLSISPGLNPVSDTTGENCMVSQRGQVWFLAGAWGGMGTEVRSCSVPEGKSLFFPVFN